MNALKVQISARLITMQSMRWLFVCVSLPILAKSISKTLGVKLSYKLICVTVNMLLLEQTI